MLNVMPLNKRQEMPDNQDEIETEMGKRQSGFQKDWPSGLRIIFWFIVLELPIAIIQVCYFIFIRHELKGEISFQGFYALSITFLALIAIYYGIRSDRRKFILACLIVHTSSAFAILYMLVYSITEMINQFVRVNYTLGSWIEGASMYIGWNFILIFVNIVILYYLWHYECKNVGK